jgi:DNA-binding MurR/RpiR family transcriptional regulator
LFLNYALLNYLFQKVWINRDFNLSRGFTVSSIKVVQNIHSLLAIPRTQKKVMAFFEFFYYDIPFFSVDDIASRSGVSKATVVRAIQRLGYTSFDELKNEVREALYSSPESPAQRSLKRPSSLTIEAIVNAHRERELENLQETYRQLDYRTLAGLCESLIAAERVWVYGQRFSYGLAFGLGLFLSQLLPAVFTVSGEAGTLADSLSSAQTSDHVVIIAHRRIGAEKAALINLLIRKKVPYSLITDLQDHPICEKATHIVHAVTTSVGAFNLYSSSYSIIQAIASILEICAPSAKRRLTETEIAFQHLGTFSR